MKTDSYTYIVVGGGLAGASAIEGIREKDPKGSILFFCDEKCLPYDRPPLSKKLWFGKKRIEDIFLHDQKFYDDNRIELAIGVAVTSVDPTERAILDQTGKKYHYEKLLLATGGAPRVLPIAGGNLSGVCYYRSLDDYKQIRGKAIAGKSAVVIGGGFIGSEIAAALNLNKVKVTMVYPEEHLCSKVFPDYLASAIQKYYLAKGIEILSLDRPSSISSEGSLFRTRTEKGKEVVSDMVIVGIGINPNVPLALNANLKTTDGIVVNEYLQTSDPNIYAAGDNAQFPCRALGKMIRMEHWDNALNQGKQAGRNMAGKPEPYDHLPYFFSDLFEFGYEAVGVIDSRLETYADWQDENRKGVIYYLDNNKVRGVMFCNVWGKVDAGRRMILSGETVTANSLRGAIRE